MKQPLLLLATLLFVLTAPAQKPVKMTDDQLLEEVQKHTFKDFWDFAHPVSGLARERSNVAYNYRPEVITTGGSGFGIMAIVVATERKWITRDQATERMLKIVNFLANGGPGRSLFRVLSAVVVVRVGFSGMDRLRAVGLLFISVVGCGFAMSVVAVRFFGAVSFVGLVFFLVALLFARRVTVTGVRLAFVMLVAGVGDGFLFFDGGGPFVSRFARQVGDKFAEEIDLDAGIAGYFVGIE